MPHTNKRTGRGPSKRPPVNRKVRKPKNRKKAGPTLGRTSKRVDRGEVIAVGKAAASTSNPDEGTLASRSPSAADSGREGDSELHDTSPQSRRTDRPVARSVKPPAKALELERGKVNPVVLGIAAVLMAAVLWVIFGKTGSTDDATPVARTAQETTQAAARSPEPTAAQQAAARPEPVNTDLPTEDEGAEQDTDSDAVAKPAVRRRVLSAKPGRKLRDEGDGEAVAPTGPFSRDMAANALSEAAQQASSCRQEGDPTGVARVVVTFAPSGRVTSATIGGPPFAGTQTGSCIAKTMRQMSVPPFEGQYVTISKTVVIM